MEKIGMTIMLRARKKKGAKSYKVHGAIMELDDKGAVMIAYGFNGKIRLEIADDVSMMKCIKEQLELQIKSFKEIREQEEGDELKELLKGKTN